MKLIIDRIKLAERSFASGRMRYIRILCEIGRPESNPYYRANTSTALAGRWDL